METAIVLDSISPVDWEVDKALNDNAMALAMTAALLNDLLNDVSGVTGTVALAYREAGDDGARRKWLSEDANALILAEIEVILDKGVAAVASIDAALSSLRTEMANIVEDGSLNEEVLNAAMELGSSLLLNASINPDASYLAIQRYTNVTKVVIINRFPTTRPSATPTRHPSPRADSDEPDEEVSEAGWGKPNP